MYGDGLAQGFVVVFGGGLVHNTMTGYANKLTTLVEFYIFHQRFSYSHNCWLVAILVLTSRGHQNIFLLPETYF